MTDQKINPIHTKSLMIQKEALRAGNWNLGGKELESFDSDVLKFDSDNLLEHLGIQAGGIFYYGMMLEYARRRQEQAEMNYDNWFAQAYNDVEAKLKETSKKDPTQKTIINTLMIEQAEEYKKHHGQVISARNDYNIIKIWNEAWKTKGFSMGAGKKTYYGDQGEIDSYGDRARNIVKEAGEKYDNS